MENQLSIIVEKYKQAFFLTDEELALARKAGELVKDDQENVLAEFHAWLETQEVLRAAFTQEVFANAGEGMQEQWNDLVNAKMHEGFVARQRGMGMLFYSAGIPYELCLSLTIAYHEIFENALVRRGMTDYKVLGTFKKIGYIGSSVIIDTYNEITTEKMRNQNTVLMEMSTPVTQLWNGILLLPLVGIIDSKRAQDTMTAMLSKIGQTQSKAFILDISGVAVMDTAVANYIIKITKATKLMGCNCIISGISGAVAQTIVELGIQIDEINTTGNMQDALNTALQMTGSQIKAIETAAA